MREIWVADSETDPFKIGRIPKPFIWGLYNGENFYTFNTTCDFINFIKNRKIIVYAHNGGKFDWHFILEYLAPFTDMMIINGRIARFKINDCEFRDSYNILPIPLDAYKKEKINYDIMESTERDKPHNKKIIYDYLKSDCQYLYELVTEFIREYGLNMTLASSAFKKWQKISGQKAPKTTKYFYDTIFPYYYGGRVECFKLGEIKQNFTVVDINSAYPKAMCENHPYGDIYVSQNNLEGMKEKDIKKCFIKLKAISKGALPYRTKDGLIFPNDNKEREYTITGWEYLSAKKLNLLKHDNILEVIEFMDEINFKQYVDYFFRLKLEAEKRGDKTLRLFAKLMLNSLYGKFGANPEKYNEYMIIDQKFIEPSTVDGYEFNGLLSHWALMKKPLEEYKQHYYNVAVAASITGCQRAYLLESLHKVKNPIYTDTDCIVCEDISSLNISDKIGDWAIEGVCTYGAIAGKKLYAFKQTNNKWKTASKGVRLTPEQIIYIAKDNEFMFKNPVPTFSYRKEPVFIDRKIKMKKT